MNATQYVIIDVLERSFQDNMTNHALKLLPIYHVLHED